jgi:hypothetical protein
MAEDAAPAPGGELEGFGGLTPATQAEQVHLLAAALRADLSDLETYERLLANSIAEVLPAGVIEIDRQRSLGERVAGRPGTVVAIRIHLGEQSFALERRHGRVVSSVSRNVRGVAISNKEVNLEEWSAAFANALSLFAEDNARARAALQRLLGV